MNLAKVKKNCVKIALECPQYTNDMNTVIALIDMVKQLDKDLADYRVAEVRDKWGVHGGIELSRDYIKEQLNKIETS